MKTEQTQLRVANVDDVEKVHVLKGRVENGSYRRDVDGMAWTTCPHVAADAEWLVQQGVTPSTSSGSVHNL